MSAEKQKEAAAYNIQLGLAYLNQGDRPRAKAKLLNALSLAPNYAEAQSAMAFYLEKTGELKEAGNFYKKAIELAPNNGAQLNNYGAYLCRIGKNKEAETFFLKAVKDIHYVNSASAYENAGLCAAADRKFTQAESYFRKALEQDPTRKQSLYQLVLIELRQNNPQKGLNDLQHYREITWNDQSLLDLGIKAARSSGNHSLENEYKLGLQKLTHFSDSTGAKNEPNNNNG